MPDATAGGGPDDPRPTKRAAMRRATLHLVLGVVALDAVALAIYRFGGIEHDVPRTRTIFTAVWMVATAVVVGLLLRRVRRARSLGQRARRG
jgi:hypothetical protein